MSLFTELCRRMPPIKDAANPDVSGIGVVIGFVATGWLLNLLLIVYYVFGHDPELDPFRKTNQRGQKAQHPNQVDVAFLTRLRIPLSYLGLGFSWLHDHQKGSKVETAFNKCVLLMSDTQIATGFSILISAFYGFSRYLSAYHWMVITYVGWFSTVTHLAALSCLRNFYINHMTKCIWRLILMFSIIVMLTAALIIGTPARALQLYAPTDKFEMPGVGRNVSVWKYAARSAYMVCIWEPGNETLSVAGPYAAFDITFSVWFLMFGFINRILKLKKGVFNCSILFRKTSRETLARISEGKDSFLCRLLGPKMYMLIIAKPLIAIRLFGRLYVELFTSLLAEIFWISVTATWGLTRLLEIRDDSPDEENTWTFGQVAAVVLLISPFCVLLDNIPSLYRSIRGIELRERHVFHRLDTHRDVSHIDVLLDPTLCWSFSTTRLVTIIHVFFNIIFVAVLFIISAEGRTMMSERIGILSAYYLLYQPLVSVGMLLLGLELEGWGFFKARGQTVFLPGLLLFSSMVGMSTWWLLGQIMFGEPVFWNGVSWALLGCLILCYGAYVGVHVFTNGVCHRCCREGRREELAMGDLVSRSRS